MSPMALFIAHPQRQFYARLTGSAGLTSYQADDPSPRRGSKGNPQGREDVCEAAQRPSRQVRNVTAFVEHTHLLGRCGSGVSNTIHVLTRRAPGVLSSAMRDASSAACSTVLPVRNNEDDT
jgi:hypothetical protein